MWVTLLGNIFIMNMYLVKEQETLSLSQIILKYFPYMSWHYGPTILGTELNFGTTVIDTNDPISLSAAFLSVCLSFCLFVCLSV